MHWCTWIALNIIKGKTIFELHSTIYMDMLKNRNFYLAQRIQQPIPKNESLIFKSISFSWRKPRKQINKRNSDSNFCNWLYVWSGEQDKYSSKWNFFVTWQIFIILDDNFTTFHRQTVISSGLSLLCGFKLVKVNLSYHEPKPKQ